MTQRQEIIERLNGLELEGGSHEMLSAICKAVLPHSSAWTLRMCEDLRDRLVRLLGEAEQPKEQGEGGEYSMDELQRAYGDGYDAGFASADDWCAQHEDAMNKHGWVKLPKGADGEYIHVGDMVYDGLSLVFTPKKVKMLMLEGDEWMLNFGSGWSSTKNHEWHHYHAPTVEDVLTDCCRRYYEAFRRSLEDRDHDKPTASEVIEQFAKRLRLVDDGKEQ